MSTHRNLDGLEQLIGVEELSEYLGVPVKTIYDWRLSGHGPCAIRVGRHLKYAVSDVSEWLASQRESVPGRAAAWLQVTPPRSLSKPVRPDGSTSSHSSSRGTP